MYYPFRFALFLGVCSLGNCLIEDVLDVLHISKEVVSGVLKTWEIVEQTHLGEQIEIPIFRQKQKKVLNRLIALSRQIDVTKDQYTHNSAWGIESINKFTKLNSRLELNLNEMENIIHLITTRFHQMQAYESPQYKFEKQTIIDFAEWMVSPNAHATNYLLERLHLLLVGTSDLRTPNKSLLTMLNDNLQDSNDHLCATNQSDQQFIFSLYSDITLTELKGYMLLQFSWMMLRIYEKGNFTDEAIVMRKQFEERANKSMKLVQEVMKRSDRAFLRCDPESFIKGRHFDEVTRLLQGYVENEVDMNPEGTCRENCEFYEKTKHHSCYKNMHCSKQPKCNGNLYNCQYFDSDMSICPSTRNSTRRYEYIEYENGRILGVKNKCSRGISKVDSWWRYLFWHCSYCMCLCDERGGQSDRYFNLRSTMANIEENKVVIGLRFIKRKRVFHIQIQEGQLLPRGNINSSTIRWKPVDDYHIFDRDVEDKRDYHTLDAANRAIDLDDIISKDPNLVVTGVRFRTIGAHLNLQAHFSEYNFETGKLVAPKSMSIWKSNDNTDFSDIRRIELKLRNPDIPTKSLIRSLEISKHNQFIEFTHSDFDKDAAQTTVPFIDIQDVTMYPPVPLAGVGIYHKGTDGFGGFIAPKLITYDFAPYMQLSQE